MSISTGELVDQRYRVVHLLGQGGYGAVYLAEDTRLGNKLVALKECFDKSAAAQEQFELEAQLLAGLNHAGLPRVSDHFVGANGARFLVMDYIEGEDLDARLVRTGRPLPEQEAISLLLQVCDAVAYLHTRRPQPVIHRDIKPTNIKITRDGRAMLVDFGIAKLYHPQKGTARFAKAVTPHFSPPEQHISKTDTRSDVYSLGATLYVLVTAQLPADAMSRLNHNTLVTPPGQINPQVSPALEQIILQAMDLTAERRFANANRMAAALRTLLQDRSISQVAVRICPRCGYRNRPGARYCVRDGTDLEGTAPDLAHKASGGPYRQPAAAKSAPSAAAPSSSGAQSNLSPEMLFESANALAHNREYERAAANYEQCLRTGFTALAIYHNLGICYIEMGCYANAISILEQGAAAGGAPDGDIQYQLARACEAANLPAQALAAAKSACRLDAADPANWRQYGRLLFNAGRYVEAISQLERAIALDSAIFSAHLLLGRCYGEQDDLRQAIVALQEAARLNPLSPEPHYWLGVYYFNSNRHRQARAAIERALSISPGHQPARQLLEKL